MRATGLERTLEAGTGLARYRAVERPEDPRDARVARRARRHLVRDVRPANASVEVGEPERSAPATVAERTRVWPERQLTADQHEPKAPAHLEAEHEIFGVALLLDGSGDRLLVEQPRTTEFPCASE